MLFQLRVADTELRKAKLLAPAFDPICQLGQFKRRQAVCCRARVCLIRPGHWAKKVRARLRAIRKFRK